MNILIEITESKIRLILKKEKTQLDEIGWSGSLNLSEVLLERIDTLLVKNKLNSSDINRVDLKSNISDNLTTARIAEIVAKTFNYSNGVD